LNPFSALIEEDLIEIRSGKMAAVAKDFPQSLFLHWSTLAPGHMV